MYCIHDVDVQFSRCSVDVENTTQEVIWKNKLNQKFITNDLHDLFKIIRFGLYSISIPIWRGTAKMSKSSFTLSKNRELLAIDFGEI